MVGGFNGRILRVNLTDGKTWVDEMPDSFYRRYLGGNGFIAYYLLHEMPAGVDPLGPDNLLIFAHGRIHRSADRRRGAQRVGGKSPLTGGYGEADVGGYFGAELKQAGYDAVVIHGKAEKPVYLWINDGEVEIRAATHSLGQEHAGDAGGDPGRAGRGARIRLAMIGPGGEKLVRYACVINDLQHAAGRTGMGAVMGSKNLKAVAARGKGRVPVADQDKFRELSRFMVDHWKERAGEMHDLGTPGGLIGPERRSARCPRATFRMGSSRARKRSPAPRCATRS